MAAALALRARSPGQAALTAGSCHAYPRRCAPIPPRR